LAIASLTFSVLSFLVMVIGLVLVFYPGMRESLAGATSGMGSTGSGILDNLKIAGVLGGALSPDIVLLIGFISDLMNLKFRFSVTSIIGIIAVILHWVIGGSIFGFSKGLTSAVASTASAITSAVAPKAPTASAQLFGVGDGNPTAPSVSPPAATAAAAATVAAPASPPGVLGAIAKPERLAATRKLTMPTGNKPPTRRPGSVSTGPDMGESAPAAAPASRTVSFAARPQRKTAAAATEANQKLAANKMTGGAALPDYITQKFNPCAIRGLGYFDISGSPMGMAALSAVFMVYLLDMTVGNKRSSAQAGGFAGFSIAVFLLNVYSYRELKCIDATSVTASLKALVLPLAVGLLSGTGGYYVLKNNYADFLPLDGTHFDDGTGGGTTPSPANRNQAHCEAPNDQGEMVCEAYRDGKRVNAA